MTGQWLGSPRTAATPTAEREPAPSFLCDCGRPLIPGHAIRAGKMRRTDDCPRHGIRRVHWTPITALRPKFSPLVD